MIGWAGFDTQESTVAEPQTEGSVGGVESIWGVDWGVSAEGGGGRGRKRGRTDRRLA